MKILLINTVCGFGSTGNICLDLAQALERIGHQPLIAYGQKTTNYPQSYKIGTKLENHLHNLLSRLTGLQGYYSNKGTKKLIQKIIEFNPDVIHLHNLHGNYLNFKLLFDFLAYSKIPVIWTLHDCWPFTGKCAHFTNVKCYKWESHCKNCPQVSAYPKSVIFDRSSKCYLEKMDKFTKVKNLILIPVSNWLLKEVKRSFLQNLKMELIYNWVDFSIFKPNISNLRKDLQITDDQLVVLCVAASWKLNDRKYLDLLNLAKLVKSDTQIVLVGKLPKNAILPKNIKHIPYLHDKSDLVKYYSMADVYVHLSVEDTFGKVIAEALSCGTPAIVFNSTACPEIVGHNCGYIVQPGNVQEINNSINIVRKNGKLFYSNSCIKFAKSNFDMNNKVQQTIELYQKALR